MKRWRTPITFVLAVVAIAGWPATDLVKQSRLQAQPPNHEGPRLQKETNVPNPDWREQHA